MDGSANSVSADSAGMTLEDLAALRRAAQSLEHPGFAARLTNMLGKPIELIGHALPASESQVIVIRPQGGIGTMRCSPHAASQLLHKALATASGAAGGAFGLAALPFELPVSTIVMLRSIALREARVRIFRSGYGTFMRSGICSGRTRGLLHRHVSARVADGVIPLGGGAYPRPTSPSGTTRTF